MAPPIVTSVTRGTKPATKPRIPFCRKMPFTISPIRTRCSPLCCANIIRVFTTSIGVVTPAENGIENYFFFCRIRNDMNLYVYEPATPPAIAPHTATVAHVDVVPVNRVQFNFKYSHNGYCTNANGNSLIIVTPNPRYRPRRKPSVRYACVSMLMALWLCCTWRRCLAISTGTRTIHETISPIAADVMCTKCVCVPLACGSNCLFSVSYVQKNIAADGTEPATTGLRPL